MIEGNPSRPRNGTRKATQYRRATEYRRATDKDIQPDHFTTQVPDRTMAGVEARFHFQLQFYKHISRSTIFFVSITACSFLWWASQCASLSQWQKHKIIPGTKNCATCISHELWESHSNNMKPTRILQPDFSLLFWAQNAGAEDYTSELTQLH